MPTQALSSILNLCNSENGQQNDQSFTPHNLSLDPIMLVLNPTIMAYITDMMGRQVR